MNSELLKDLLVVMGVALGVVLLLRQVKVPAVVGFLIAGVLLGKGGLHLVKEEKTIELLAECGVVFLLFSIGLKFSLRELVRMKTLVLGAGGLQVALTAGVTAAVVHVYGIGSLPQGIFAGFLVAMSSTAIVLKLLEDAGQTDALHGKFTIAVLIFQDLAVVPIMLAVPLLAGKAVGVGAAVLTLLKSLGMIALILAAARWVFPWLLERVARTRSRELFTLAAFGVALGTASLAHAGDLSLSLGAFIAGLVLSESDYAHQISTEISPLRDGLSSLFFVSVGMLVAPRVWIEHPGQMIGMTAGIFIGKALLVAVVAWGLGFGTRIAILARLGLAQIGEFSFILASHGKFHGLISADAQERFLGVSVVTMVLTPLALLLAPRLAAGDHHQGAWLARALGGAKAAGNVEESPAAAAAHAGAGHGGGPGIHDHVIIVGYGVNGKNVVRVLRQLEVPYLILELNPYTVRALHEAGERTMYGDSTRDVVLQHAGIEDARVLVVGIGDPVSARQTVAVARRLRPDLKIFVRARYVGETAELMKLGATEVVAEEFETSLELSAEVMAAYGASERLIQKERDAIRHAAHHPTRRRRSRSLQALVAAADVEEVEILRGSPSVGQSLETLALRRRAGASIMAVSRKGELHGNPGGGFVLEAGDILFLFGNQKQNKDAHDVLAPEGTSERLPLVDSGVHLPDLPRPGA